MNDEKELERHSNIINQIKNARTREDLPNVNFSNIASFLANNVHFNKEKISQTMFKPVIDEIINYGFVGHQNVRTAFIRVILENYPNVTEEEVIEKYNYILKSKRISYLINEIGLKNERLEQITKTENKKIHDNIMKEIRQAFEIKDLPKVGLSELNKKLLKAVNDNDFNRNFKISDIKELTDIYLSDSTYREIEETVEKLCLKEDLSAEEKLLMKEQILGSLLTDETIEYVIEEIHSKENRKRFIYKNDHDERMEIIKQARRISQLPPNLTFSSLTGYLNGNTTIYTNDDRIKAEDLKHLTELLLDGYKWEHEPIIEELHNIINNVYPDKDDAFDLLFNKLSNLPKTYYLVDEINYSLSRQREFIGNNCSNVNVYFIPNDKSPIDGGRFYNCYINRIENLDLSQILPSDLDEIDSPTMDSDSVEWYVQENYDSTFKIAGGIILNKDETIGAVNVFRPNDGTVGVSPEEKAKMDAIADLDKQIEVKQEELSKLETELKEKEQKSSEVENGIKQLLQNYEKKALELQMELLKSISELKNSLGYEEEEKGKELK